MSRHYREKVGILLGGALPMVAMALGLGNIQLHSGLNQPLVAEIPVFGMQKMSEQDVQVSIAPESALEAAQIDPTPFLKNIQFSWHINAKKEHFLRLTSNQPVTEPFLNLLLRVNSPDGQLQREYTLLMDLPKDSARSHSSHTHSSGLGASHSNFTPVKTTTSMGAPTASLIPAGAGEHDYVTQPGDSLWAIALKVRPNKNIDVHQVMVGLLNRNPQAFLGGNLNQLQANQVLVVPTEAAFQAVDATHAVMTVAEHNRAQQRGLPIESDLQSPAQVDRALAQDLPQNFVQKPQQAPAHALLTPDSHPSNNASIASAAHGVPMPASVNKALGTTMVADVAALQKMLTEAQASIVSQKQANTVLTSQLQAANNQVADLKAQLLSKNEQLVQLNTKITALEQMQNQSSLNSIVVWFIGIIGVLSAILYTSRGWIASQWANRQSLLTQLRAHIDAALKFLQSQIKGLSTKQAAPRKPPSMRSLFQSPVGEQAVPASKAANQALLDPHENSFAQGVSTRPPVVQAPQIPLKPVDTNVVENNQTILNTQNIPQSPIIDLSNVSAEVTTKLDLARAYMEMDDFDGAASLINEVLEKGDPKQKATAQALLSQIKAS